VSNLERAPELTIAEEGQRPAQHPVLEVTPGREVDLGEGTPVVRLLPKRQRSTLGAWCFIDHFGPLDIDGHPGMMVPAHPHIGLQTVTWLVDGEVFHRDSIGNEQLIRPGQLNLMTAGRGISHAEESPASHPRYLHGVQLWVALPERSEQVEPSFELLPELPVVETSGARITVLVGELAGAASPAALYSELVGADIEIGGSADELFYVRADFEYGVVMLSGQAAIDGTELQPGNLLYLGLGRREITLQTAAPARFLLLGGTPFGEPLFMWWNFVAHSAEAIVQARSDWESGDRFGQVTGFDGVPLAAPPLPPGQLKPRG
jgi:redox-sensitive bicupin YhaK (pirin superfamily)